MTQPPGWPPQGGYGPPPPPPPQQPPRYPGSYGPPPVPNYGVPYGTYPPPPPTPPGRNRAAIVVASVVAAVVLIGGGVYFGTNNGDGGANDSKPLADKNTSAPPSESASTADTVDPSSDVTVAPPATGVVGQWQDETDKTLTIGAEYTSGDYVGDYPLSYIDPGGKGILTGMGTDRSDGSFRMVLKSMSTESSSGDGYISATVTRSGDSVDITWDDGGIDTLAYVGE